MAKGLLIGFSNPFSAERDVEYNEWYNGIHADQMMALPGFASMKRFKVVHDLTAGAGSMKQQYLTIYEVDNIDAALGAIAAAQAAFIMPDSLVDMSSVSVFAYEEIYDHSRSK